MCRDGGRRPLAKPGRRGAPAAPPPCTGSEEDARPLTARCTTCRRCAASGPSARSAALNPGGRALRTYSGSGESGSLGYLLFLHPAQILEQQLDLLAHGGLSYRPSRLPRLAEALTPNRHIARPVSSNLFAAVDNPRGPLGRKVAIVFLGEER